MRDEIIVPWISGQSLAVRRGMTGATGNIYVGLHEFADMMLPLHFLREGDLFLDIGANVGSYTVLASGVRRAHTWAFEPDPYTVCNLKRNIEVNKLNELVTVYELALGASDAALSFTVGRDTMNKFATAEDKNVQSVRQQPLDKLIGAHRPVMIKMDVEGYEEEVLRGAQSLLTNDCLQLIELETVTSQANAMLQANGFKQASYDPFSRKLEHRPSGQSSGNSVFVKDWDFVISRLTTATPIEVLGRRI